MEKAAAVGVPLRSAGTAEGFYRAGIETVEDLLSYYPRTYETFEEPVTDVSHAADGQLLAVCGFLYAPVSVRHIKGMQIVTGLLRLENTNVQQEDASLPVTWFNMPYLRSALKPGTRYVMRGIIKLKGKRLTLSQPAVYSPEDYAAKMQTLQPVYPLVKGLRKTLLQKAMQQALFVSAPAEYLPEDLLKRFDLAGYSEAVRQIHFPSDPQMLLRARNRLAFDEFLIFILRVKNLKKDRENTMCPAMLTENDAPERLIASLPYRLTKAQEEIWHTVHQELLSGKAMARLIQGDVGCGKTILAFLAMVFTAQNGAQAALMAPTEVLARQHYQAFIQLCSKVFPSPEDAPFGAVLLTGSMRAREKNSVCRKIADGRAKIVIGTHALFQEHVSYQNLALAVTDEQHRFGVEQRQMLYEKGVFPHLMVMSATPIPRTLAGILYGDLDISTVHEMPAGRLRIKTCVIPSESRAAAYRFLKKEADAGHQAYVICPMVEESEGLEAENVTDYAKQLRDILPGIPVEGLHGRMKSEEKQEIMQRFADGQTTILVSTTVIEVGVNVPNATVMMIEDAQRFGLAQLHQLRGRVGRGSAQSYCILVSSDQKEVVSKRLDIMNRSDDGFEIAAKDLELRGPGDLFGIRQSGEMAFEIADIYRDGEIMKMANEAAGQILLEDSTLHCGKYALLHDKLLSCQKKAAKKLNI